MVTVAVTGGLLAFLFFMAVLYNIFRMLSFMKIQMSTSTYERHRAVVRSLLAQFATSSVCFLPPISLVFVVFFKLPHAQVLVELLLVIACIHSPLNVTVLVLTFPPYRAFASRVILRRESPGLAPISAKTSVVVSVIACCFTDIHLTFLMQPIPLYPLVSGYVLGYSIHFSINSHQCMIACCFTDIHLTFLMQPVPLYPLVSGYVLGVTIHFGANTHHCMIAVTFLFIYQIGSMIACFLRKHEAIAGTLKKYSIPHSLLFLMILYVLIYTCTVTGIYSTLSVPDNEKLAYVEKNHPKYLSGFQSVPTFSIYDPSDYFVTCVFCFLAGGVFAFLTLVLVILNIFRMLSILKSKISASTYQKHRTAVFSLLAQFMTSSVIFVPPIIFVVVVLIGINGAQIITKVLLMLACTHSPLNVIVLIATFPPYRKFVSDLFSNVVYFLLNFQCVIIFLLIYQIGSMITCFVRKHQAIAKTLKRYRMPNFLVFIMIFYVIVYTCSVTGIFATCSVPDEEKLDYVTKNYPEYLSGFESIPNFSIYDPSDYFANFVIYSLVGGIIAFLTLVLVLLNIFRMLNVLKSKLSASTYQKHRSAIYSLLAQFATSSVIFVPPIFFVFIVLLGINGAQCNLWAFHTALTF
ncbi:hypothetical protein CAEBREN_29141 [Caenorhabditis brenneri]|uniref:G protein-coupled receptor n=1 Tax=Caenorhabditis brenneri TaxID=135651 RepID=G0NL55_CAEBE|nr:hypothetical protein CAEBREN_29141 [Caenorhabditis brenneri]